MRLKGEMNGIAPPPPPVLSIAPHNNNYHDH